MTTAVLCIALLSFLSGCEENANKQTSQREEREKNTLELFSYMPADDYLSLGYGDIDALMQNTWVQQLIELIPPLQLWDEKLGISVDSFHSIAMAFLPPKADAKEDEEEGLILMKSDLAADDIFAMLGEKSHFFTEKKIANGKLYRSGKDFGFGFVSENIIALGTPSLVEKAIWLANGKGKSLANTKKLDRYRQYFGSSDNIWMGFDGIDKYLSQAATEVTMLRNFTHIEFIYFGMASGDDIASRVILECDNEQSAGKITRGLNGLLGVMGTLIDMQDLDIDVTEYSLQVPELKAMMEEFFSNINISNEKKNVEISFLIPNRMIEFMLDSTRKAIQDSRQDAVPDDLDEGSVEVESDWRQ